MTISQIHVLFHVPEGFEEIATLDIKESLLPFEGLDPLSTIYISEAKTGRVHLFSKIHQEIEIKQWWDFLSNIALVCVYHMTLITTTTTIPIQDVYHDNKKIMDEQENQEEKEEDNVLGQYIQSKVKHTNWQAYLNHIQQDNNNEDTSSSAKTTFRATFYKDQLTHSMKTQDISGWIGYAYSELYPLWKVNLKKYDYNIVGIWGKSKDQALLAHCLCKDETIDSSLKEGKEEEETRPILLYLGIEIPMPDPKYRNRVHLGRTSLNPPIASCLVRLADPQPGQIIFDMCCGTGTIPIEGASKYPNTLWVGGEDS
ncbi:hypothetical protein BJ944DRAFT_232012 [Cunninghamella echinulata]|nr:hypothetical protein BJ944DRAFT_232012 [Cunninghamella echinulata]